MGGPVVTAGPTAPVARYPLGMDMAVVITEVPAGADGPHWSCTVQREDSEHHWHETREGDGAAQALVDVLRHRVTVPAEGFRVVRLVPPPEATGERAVEADPPDDTAVPNTAVVVGERVVVTWIRQLSDIAQPATVTVAHLAEVQFLGTPVTYGMLTWRSPSGHEIPCAVATGYLPHARNGWVWGPELVEQQLGIRPTRGEADAAGLGTMTASPTVPEYWVEDFPSRIGQLAAKLHLALAKTSTVLPHPVQYADAATVRAWHAAALRRLEAVERLARARQIDDAGKILLPRLPALRAAIDGLLRIADALPQDPDRIAGGEGVPVQRIHGDLHAGQLLRSSRGLTIVDFDGSCGIRPNTTGADAGIDPLLQPAARDLARLLLSLDHLGRIADQRAGFGVTAAVDEWSRQAQAELLAAYRYELGLADRQEMLDERLLEAFRAEQVCHDLLDAFEFQPLWAYAPLAELRLMSEQVEEPRPGGRHRATPQITARTPRPGRSWVRARGT